MEVYEASRQPDDDMSAHSMVEERATSSLPSRAMSEVREPEKRRRGLGTRRKAAPRVGDKAAAIVTRNEVYV